MKIRFYPLLILFACLGFLCLIFFLSNITLFTGDKKILLPDSTTDTEPQKQNAQSIFYQDKTYTYEYFIVSDVDRLKLIANFSDSTDAKSVSQKNNCTYAINAGFYDTANKPLGLWIGQEGTIGKTIESTLLRGYYWIENAKASITLAPPTSPRLALQTGPALILNGVPTKLLIKNDTFERRSIVFLLPDNSSVFMILFDGESVYNGPKLGDLPQILSAIGTKHSWDITSALNLDGGSASAFVSPSRSLQELTPVGSIFCMQ